MHEINSLLRDLDGPMSKAWHEAYDLQRHYEDKAKRALEGTEETGNRLCQLATRILKEKVRDAGCGSKWCSVWMNGPGYITQHGGPKVLKLPYLRFCISIGGNSEIRYNHWPKDLADIHAVCCRLAEAAAVLLKPTAAGRVAT